MSEQSRGFAGGTATHVHHLRRLWHAKQASVKTESENVVVQLYHIKGSGVESMVGVWVEVYVLFILLQN